MTNEQAIKDFEGTNENYRDQLSKYGYVMDKAEKDVVNQIIERNELAISALSENKGEWIIDDMDSGILTRIWACHCSICGKDPQTDISGTENWWLDKLPNFCPNCGADMSETKGEKGTT